jgi:hypothetical protein
MWPTRSTEHQRGLIGCRQQCRTCGEWLSLKHYTRSTKHWNNVLPVCQVCEALAKSKKRGVGDAASPPAPAAMPSETPSQSKRSRQKLSLPAALPRKTVESVEVSAERLRPPRPVRFGAVWQGCLPVHACLYKFRSLAKY